MLYKLFLFRLKWLTPQEKTALDALISQRNFIISKNDLSKPLIILRYTYRELLRIIKLPVNKISNRNKVLLINDGEKGVLNATNILIQNKVENNFSKTSHETIAHFSLFHKIQLIILLIISYPFITLIQKRFSNKLNVLSLPNIISNCFIIKSQVINRFDKVYLFGCYKPETNLISLILQKNNIETAFFVSGTPLVYFFQNIVCNELLISNPYQIDEIKNKVLKNAHFETFKLLKPLKLSSFTNFYSTPPPSNTIAIYTSGIWKRKKAKLPFIAEMEINESHLFNYLSTFLEKRPHYALTILFHPIEKQNMQDYEYAKKYYQKKLDNKTVIKFEPMSCNTIDLFSKFDVALSIISNTIYERLYCGYKVLFVNTEKDGMFPIENSSLFNICVDSYDSFVNKLQTVLNYKTEEYFKELNLEKYHFQGYKQ